MSNDIENKADEQTNLFHNIIIIGQFTENLKNRLHNLLIWFKKHIRYMYKYMKYFMLFICFDLKNICCSITDTILF